MSNYTHQPYGGATSGAMEFQARQRADIEKPISCTKCGSGYFQEVTYNKYSDIAMGSGTGGDIRVISDVPQMLRVCLCGYPYNPNLTGTRGRVATAELQAFQRSLKMAHEYLAHVATKPEATNFSDFTSKFAGVQELKDLQDLVGEIAAAQTAEVEQRDEPEVVIAAPVVVEAALPVVAVTTVVGEGTPHFNSREGKALRVARVAAEKASA